MCHPYRKATGQPLMVDGHFTEDYKRFIRNQFLAVIQKRRDKDHTGRDRMKTSREGNRNRESAGFFGDILF